MGANQSKQSVLNETLNEIAISVMTKNSTNLSGSIDQSNVLSVVGNKGKTKISGVTQVNISKINVAALAQSSSNNSLQADLISKLKASVDQAVPSLAINSKVQQDVHNTITNSVNQNITTENLMNIATQVKNSNEIKFVANEGINASDLIQKNEAELIIALVNDTTSTIVNKVAATGELNSATTSVQSSVLPDFGGSIGMIFILIIIVIIIGGGYYLSTLSFADIVGKPVPMAIIATMIISVLGGGYLAISSISSE